MSAKIFPTAQDAENAFYEALERADLEAMMAVWSEDEEIVCVHPAGQRLAGQEQVREAWRQMFAGGPGMRVQIAQQVAVTGMMVAVHSVHENITVTGEQRARPPMVATNVYLRTPSGWRMIVHHASPAPGGPAAEAAPAGPAAPKIPPLKSEAGSYSAPWWLPGGHLQTIFAALAPAPRIAFRRERWDTPDGDFIDLDWAGTDGPLIAVFHGLEGSSASPYARAIAARALALGWRCVVPHFRGCSGELNRLARAYHSGDSAELGWILDRLGARHAVGISLGGNALLKLLGERGAAMRLDRAVAISAPLDLAVAGRALDRGFSREVYTRTFLRTLKKKTFEKIRRQNIAVDARRLGKARTFWEFDDTVTAPLHGFLGADDYWARSSSAPWLAKIRVPTLVLNARNDPFMPESALDGLGQVPANVVLEFPRSGGHAGFPGRGRWLAKRVLEFLTST